MRPDGAIPIRWRRSGYCQSNNGCVEVARVEEPAGPSVAIRDGTLPAAGALSLRPPAWRDLLVRVKAGGLDR